MAPTTRAPPAKKPKVEDAQDAVPPQQQPPQQQYGTPQGQQPYQRPPGAGPVRPPFQLGRLPQGQVARPPMMGTPTQQQRPQMGQQNQQPQQQQQQGAPANQNGNAQAGSSNQASSSYNTGTPGPTTRSNAGQASLDDLTDGIIDYKAEEEALQRHAQPAFRPRPNGAVNPAGVKAQAFLDPAWLRRRMTEVAKQEYALTINEDCIAYLSLAAEARVRDLLEAMIKAKNHRLTSTHAHPPPLYADGVTPLWNETITSEPAKWLATIERVEKEEEGRKRRDRNARDEEERRRKEMGDDYNGPLGMDVEMGTPGGIELDADGNPKKKKKSGPGVTARNMSEQAQKRMANSAALFSAGVKKKHWMFQSAGAGIAPSPSPASRTLNASSPLAGGASPPAFGGAAADASASSSKPFNPSSLSQSSNAIGSSTPVQSSWSKPFLSSTAGTPLGPPVHAASAPSHPRQNSGGFGGGGVGGNARQEPTEVGLVSMRDAMFVLEKERGHGAGKGSATRLVAKSMAKRNDRGWE